jgi:hypothetical protein
MTVPRLDGVACRCSAGIGALTRAEACGNAHQDIEFRRRVESGFRDERCRIEPHCAVCRIRFIEHIVQIREKGISTPVVLEFSIDHRVRCGFVETILKITDQKAFARVDGLEAQSKPPSKRVGGLCRGPVIGDKRHFLAVVRSPVELGCCSCIGATQGKRLTFQA